MVVVPRADNIVYGIVALTFINICRNLQIISACVTRYLHRYLVTQADIWSRRKEISHRNQYKP
jgi:hypothetical protein